MKKVWSGAGRTHFNRFLFIIVLPISLVYNLLTFFIRKFHIITRYCDINFGRHMAGISGWSTYDGIQCRDSDHIFFSVWGGFLSTFVIKKLGLQVLFSINIILSIISMLVQGLGLFHSGASCRKVATHSNFRIHCSTKSQAYPLRSEGIMILVLLSIKAEGNIRQKYNLVQ